MPISSTSLGSRSLKGFDTLDLPSKDGRDSKSARDAIFSLSGTGIDRRTAKQSLEELDNDGEQKPNLQRGPAPTGFIKPAGVAEPTPRIAISTTIPKPNAPKQMAPDIIDGARKKRSRDVNEAVDEGKKKKKKKRSALNTSGTDA
jgi:hypothetical protein